MSDNSKIVIDNLQNFNDFLNTILTNLHSSVFVLSKERQIQSVNKAGVALLGKDEKAIINNVFGNALDCMYTEEGRLQCGFTPYCNDCKLLKTLRKICRDHEPEVRNVFERKYITNNGNTIEKYFLYSVRMINYNGDHMALLIVDDITETEKQKAMLQKRNEQIYSSIQYAERIQRALLPDQTELEKYFEDFFLFYKPKEIIGGDFYWGARVGGKSVVSVSDCTGHGIPGALITMLGITGLNEIVKAQKETRPEVILNKLRSKILHQLNNSESIDNQDGMEIGICTIDHHSRRIWFAGANHEIILVNNSVINKFKGNPFSISPFKKEQNYTVKKIDYKPGDMLYLYSDGYKDQFGEEIDKKFGKKRFYRLIDRIKDLNPFRQKQIVINTFKNWKGDVEQVDDVTFLGIMLN
jgi:serine phosphatase RsbU (regulator of sigma subunit)